MTAESPASSLEAAWAHFPQSRQAAAGIGAFTRLRVERIISLAVGLGCIVLGAQAFLTALGSTEERPGWHEPLLIVVFIPLLAMILACLIGRGVRVTAGTFALVYVIALAIWPIATMGSQPRVTDEPWIWYLVNVATVAAVLAFPLPLQIVWTALAPLMFGVVRLVQGGFARDFWFSVLLDVSFALILGGVFLTLGWMFRSVAANVDQVRTRAVDSYARATAAEAAEQERVAVAALMHDSVLAALIAVERSDTPRRQTLAAAMAREALTRLANPEREVEEGSDAPHPVTALADDIEHGARELGVRLTVARDINGVVELPGRVARALALAATQAVANALEHARGAGLTVALLASTAQVDIDVRDAGSGFDLDDVPDDRLGIRASILARVQAVGGSADIRSDAAGTTVHLTWRSGAP